MTIRFGLLTCAGLGLLASAALAENERHRSSSANELSAQVTIPYQEFKRLLDAASVTKETQTEPGWQLEWRYPDVIGAQAIGMSMPDLLNPGPVAERVTLYAPVSLLFFVTVLLVLAMARNLAFHPMNFFFIAGGQNLR
jgi:hypothetical protein